MDESLPEPVARAERLARDLRFPNSCTRRVGRLLRTLAAHARGPVLELGTGCGVGTAWLRSGLPEGGRLVTIDDDASRHEAARTLFGGDDGVVLLRGDWREALGRGPYALAFIDVGPAKDDGADAVIDAMSVGGLLVLDDFTPGPTYQGEIDERWRRWMEHPGLATCEILVGSGSAVLLATRIA